MHGHKPHKGTLKRIRITKSGRVKGRVANGSHLRSGKGGTRLRHMRKARFLADKGITDRLGRLLGRRIRTGKEQDRAAQAAKAEAKAHATKE